MTEYAKLNFDESGIPISAEFDDIYFSKQDGLAETNYVFIEQNHLPDRWLADIEHFHIGETGFGTGLNFLATWQRLKQTNLVRAQRGLSPLRVTFTSFERFPLSQIDLAQALAHWPTLKDLTQPLIEHYPSSFNGSETLIFDDGLMTLTLVIGDVNKQMPTLPSSLGVDAWFLDGFAPSKNPDMWTEVLFKNMARLSAPAATLATFTAAGLVKRGLMSAGFDIKKVKGFGFKREMLTASITR